MKKWFLIVITMFSCSLIYADEPEKIEMLSSKVILQNTNGYFVLSGRSFWKVIGFSKRWRSPREWWNNVQLVPENYECVPNDWYLGAQIEIYSKNTQSEVHEENASNQAVLKQCTHLLVNTKTKQVLFAIALEPSDCIVQLFNEAREEGYNYGFTQGVIKGNQKAAEDYKSGYSEGYKVGYGDGCRDGLNNEEPRNY